MSTPHRIQAPAKLNLSLRVLGRRDDGFHDINSLMVRLPKLADELEFSEAAKFSFSCDDPTVPGDEGNLVIKALRAYEAAAQTECRVAIPLKKSIPHGAGLGGGSSDAAATLLALDQLHDGSSAPTDSSNLPPAPVRMCHFFLAMRPCASAVAANASSRSSRHPPCRFFCSSHPSACRRLRPIGIGSIRRKSPASVTRRKSSMGWNWSMTSSGRSLPSTASLRSSSNGCCAARKFAPRCFAGRARRSLPCSKPVPMRGSSRAAPGMSSTPHYGTGRA